MKKKNSAYSSLPCIPENAASVGELSPFMYPAIAPSNNEETDFPQLTRQDSRAAEITRLLNEEPKSVIDPRIIGSASSITGLRTASSVSYRQRRFSATNQPIFVRELSSSDLLAQSPPPPQSPKIGGLVVPDGERTRDDHSILQVDRMQQTIPVPPAIMKAIEIVEQKIIPEPKDIKFDNHDNRRDLKAVFPNCYGKPIVDIVPAVNAIEKSLFLEHPPMRVGVVLSGGQAAGGHNVIAGLFDYIKRRQKSSQLFGFLGGPEGIYKGRYMEITDEYMDTFRNQGGFDMIRSGRHKIETDEQKIESLRNCQRLRLDGLVVIGGDDSNTNAALLAEYFRANNCDTAVVGCPKTIDGDLKNEWIEISFGFDTACRTYSECIGNLCQDVSSTRNYYHFVRLMGRSASHIALECAFQTCPNICLIGEEIKDNKWSLNNITNYLCDIICKRAERGMNAGVILVPEGLIEFIPTVGALIEEINNLFAKNIIDDPDPYLVSEKLSIDNKLVFDYLPFSIRQQILYDRDLHGNVAVSKIDTERLLIDLCKIELDSRRKLNKYSGSFKPFAHFFGYEGRSGLPTHLDSNYCTSLGLCAGALVDNDLSGYMAVVKNLSNPVSEWSLHGVPLVPMMTFEMRKGKFVPVIEKSLVNINGSHFITFKAVRDTWAEHDCYRSPGPIQFDGPATRIKNYTLQGVTEEELLPSIDELKLSSDPTIWAPTKIYSLLQGNRCNYEPPLPYVLREEIGLAEGEEVLPSAEARELLRKDLPSTFDEFDRFLRRPILEIVKNNGVCGFERRPLNIGIVFAGRPAPGVQNVIMGILNFLKKEPKGSNLYGFLGGTAGLFAKRYIEITEENYFKYRNQGGCDFIGVGNDSIRTDIELEATKATILALKLHGLIICGATHSLTDAAILNDYFLRNKIQVSVISVPSSMDGNIKHHLMETTLGFDTCTKLYSQLVGNILIDAASAAKAWYFVRVMGRDPSHVVLEVGLQTHPNIALISEELASNGIVLETLVRNIADVVEERHRNNCDYGMVLIPEGLLAVIPQFRELIQSLNTIFAKELSTDVPSNRTLEEAIDLACNGLQCWDQELLKHLPTHIQKQLLLHREPQGTVQLSHIETERLLADLVSKELRNRNFDLKKFSPTTHFFGYQGRSSMPSLFDCRLGKTFGMIAGTLVRHQRTGYIVSARGLTQQVGEWRCIALPNEALLTIRGFSEAYGENHLRVPSSGVDLNGRLFRNFKEARNEWALDDHYLNPGPIQYWGHCRHTITQSLRLEQRYYFPLLEEVERLCEEIKKKARFGVHEVLLRTAVVSLRSISVVLDMMTTAWKPSGEHEPHSR